MVRIIPFILILFSLAITSCKSLKMINLLSSGEVAQENFNVEIPYEDKMGLIVLKVKIEGEEYDFLYDTGAPNVISKELFEKLNLKPYVTNKTTDSQGRKEDLEYLILPKLTIGTIDFLETGAAVADFNRSSVISCLEVDGIIGANLMQKAIWKIDYSKKKIQLAHSIEPVDIENGVCIPFSQKFTGTPITDIHVNGVLVKNVTIDTGSNGGFSLAESTFKKAKDSLSPVAIAVGTTTSGIYGVGEVDTNYYSTFPNVTIGDVQLENQLVDFNKGKSLTVGNDFFENYDVTFNWQDREMILTNRKDNDGSTFNSFGFNYFYTNDQLIVSYLVEGSEAALSGIKRGDQILSLNGIDYSQMSQDKWCEILHSAELREGSEIEVVLLMNEQEKRFNFKKTNQLIR